MLKIFLFLIFAKFVVGGTTEVQLPDGTITGREDVTFKSTPYYSFQKIPYAAPPVGNLRFKAPVPPESWDEPLDTSGTLDVICYQERTDSDKETEDCLYLNVFTPQLPTSEKNVSLPVMVFIHGGGFVSGSGTSIAEGLIDENIIFVIMNYRLGPFGFLSTEDDVIPGNNGLKDQHLAIKWTYDNIALFGGDPNQITIFGQSAGSASCSYQLLNQANNGLFRGAILESGSFLSPWAFQRRAKEIAFTTAAFLNDTFKTNLDSKALLEFLQSVDAREIDTASVKYFDLEDSDQDKEILQGFYWAPVIEVKNPDAFLTKKMYGLLKAGNVVPVPILIGMNSEEYIFYANRDSDGFAKSMATYDENLSWLVPNDMQITEEADKTRIGTEIRRIYTNGEDFAKNLGAGVRYGSDTAFTRSIIKQAELYSQWAKTYFYQFSYNGQLGHIDLSYEGAEHVGHEQELKYINCHKKSCDLSGNPEMDQITQDRLIKIWTNFARYQNPTPEPSELLQNITWPLVSTENGDFFYVNINETLEIQNHPKEDSYKKWNDLYDSLGYDDFDTY